jgi:hypothetical protein
MRLFEADIINVLAGPLAEAVYLALRDNEPFNPELVNISALQHSSIWSALSTLMN